SGALSPGASVTAGPTPSPRVALPSPIPQVISRTSAAAQIAWIGVSPQGSKASLVGIDPSGKIVGRLDRELGHFFRSADGAQLFSPDSRHLYTIVDWGGPLRLTAFDVSAQGLSQTASAIDGQAGRKLGSCGGPAIAARVVNGGRTLAVFCHVDGRVLFFDLA